MQVCIFERRNGKRVAIVVEQVRCVKEYTPEASIIVLGSGEDCSVTVKGTLEWVMSTLLKP